MIKKYFFLIFLFSLLFSRPGYSIKTGDWVASGGAGVILTPTTLFLLSPQIEYALRPHLLIGPLSQIGISSGILFAISGGVRYIFGENPRIKPNVEGGLGMAVASSLFGSSAGVNIHIGMGVDYELNKTTFIGTELIGNFAPPMQTFYLSWPIVIGRFLL